MQEAVHTGLWVFALFLVTASVGAGLVGSLVPDPAPEDTSPQASPQTTAPQARLEAVLERTDRVPVAPSGDEDAAQEPRCADGRTLQTSYRPVVLLNRSETGCQAKEAVLLSLHVRARQDHRLLRAHLALCPVPTYNMITVPRGDMISGATIPACRELTVQPPDAVASLAPWRTLRERLEETSFHTTGLHLACASALVELEDGTRHAVEDMTWFEVWDTAEGLPDRPAHQQSAAWDTGCSQVQAPVEVPWQGPDQ